MQGEASPPGNEVSDTGYEPAGPRPIKKLSKDVINQIAAAEVSSPISYPQSLSLCTGITCTDGDADPRVRSSTAQQTLLKNSSKTPSTPAQPLSK
jgi:hypothetical protein